MPRGKPLKYGMYSFTKCDLIMKYLQDTSTNGIRYNGQNVHKRAVILNDHDTVELSGESQSRVNL